MWFMPVFFAAPLASAACVVLNVWRRDEAPLPLIIAGAICSLVTFGITAAANAPLNRELDQAAIDTEEQRRDARARFEAPWNRWNLLRTITSFGALALFTIAAVSSEQLGSDCLQAIDQRSQRTCFGQHSGCRVLDVRHVELWIHEPGGNFVGA